MLLNEWFLFTCALTDSFVPIMKAYKMVLLRKTHLVCFFNLSIATTAKILCLGPKCSVMTNVIVNYTQWNNMKGHGLTDFVTPYGDLDVGQHCFQ